MAIDSVPFCIINLQKLQSLRFSNFHSAKSQIPLEVFFTSFTVIIMGHSENYKIYYNITISKMLLNLIRNSNGTVILIII